MIPTFTFGVAFVPGLTKALHAAQDAHTSLLGQGRSVHGASAAMGHLRGAGLALCNFLRPLKVI